MFIISGTRTFAKNMGTSTEFCNCNNCGQTVRLQVMRGLSFLTFFWILACIEFCRLLFVTYAYILYYSFSNQTMLIWLV